ncbi:beta-lactamase [Geobacter sp. OR-1]|uniref:MBL fold metallo-hydrolase n=1 Tax=Geobacter sp. OR-1 TaxID=1266765 RepID=UPI0005443302|nr:MBL fold metallo-hydrolase [Geobacter sp. OR-1]GAM11850.1 beta-lactamase [Geobacter sp. OR-1]
MPIRSIFIVCCLVMILFTGSEKAFAGKHYDIQKVSDSVYAAIALPSGKAASNAMFIVTGSHVILAGAHFVQETVRELVAEIGKITQNPVREIILTHHHSGYNYIDVDLPVNAEIITSWQTWQALKSEYRQVKNPVTFFEKGLTLQRENLSIVLSNTDFGHSKGDLIVYVPSEGVLFTSDLVFNRSIGYMGTGFMREWVISLEFLESLSANIVIPGVGRVTDTEGITQFRMFMKDFLTEVLRHIEKGDSLAVTKKEFKIPQYINLPGYRTFFEVNVERAYGELKEK